MAPRVSVVIVAFGAYPLLPASVRAALASSDVDVDVIVVDNGCTDGGVDIVRGWRGVSVVTPDVNLGFAGGANSGANAATGDFLAFVNPDAIVAPDAFRHLAAVATDTHVGIASACLLLADEPDRVNSAGNDVHFLGYSWCGGLGDPASAHRTQRDVASATGAAMLLGRAAWKRLGGFAAEYFMYHEDADLSLRSWANGLRVVYVPDAAVTHAYEPDRHPRKLHLLERNRLVTILTCYQRRTLVVLAPVLAVTEVAVLALAVSQRWGRAKASGWWWLLRHRRWLAERRREVQSRRTVGDAALAPLLATRLVGANRPLPAALAPFDAALGAYWRVARRLLARDP
jgi:GT2 family glycosyltransferase